MTQLCMDCGAFIREICHRCGNRKLEGAGPDWFHCPACSLPIVRGDGGESHGLCAACEPGRNAELEATWIHDASTTYRHGEATSIDIASGVRKSLEISCRTLPQTAEAV